MTPSSLYTIMNLTGKEQHDDYQSNQEDGEMEWVKQNAIKELINITSTVEPTTHESMRNSVVQNQTKYYVNMPIVFTIINLESISLIKKSN